MADVKKININSTDYDIADAKALRNKSTTATGSFVDTKAGTTPYPTTGSNLTGSTIIGGASYVSVSTNLSGITIYGSGANVDNSFATAVGASSNATLYSAAFGANSKASASYTMAAGYNARATAQYTVAIGSSSNASQNYTTALGYSASAISSHSTSVGYNASALANAGFSTVIGSSSNASGSNSVAIGYAATDGSNDGVAIGHSVVLGSNSAKSVAIGQSARVAIYAPYSTVIGAGAKNNYYNSYSVAIGYNAEVKQQYSAQIGTGTNEKYGSLQFRSWQLVDQNGKIPEERLPTSSIFATANPPRLSLVNEPNVSEIAILYTGETCSAMTNGLCYKAKIQTSRPSFDVSWVDSSYLKTEADILIDQEKLFLKFAEISQERIGDGDTWNSIVGGDNTSQDVYFYYDSSNEEWRIEFGSSSFESLDNSAPDPIENITTAQLESDFGVHVNMKNFTPEEDSDNEIFDVTYEAPIHCNGIDSNASEYITVDYMKFMTEMCDGDWGFFHVVPNLDFWEYTVDGTTYAMPIIPATYSYDEDEYSEVIMRWEWDGNLGEWYLYINGEDTGYTWPTTSMYNQFGITIESGEEENIEYIELVFEATQQRGWKRFDPIDSADYCTKQEKQDMQGDINRLQNNSFRLIQNARDLDTMTTAGQYRVEAIGSTNLPTQASNARFFWLFVTNYANTGTEIRQVLIADHVTMTSGAGDYSRYAPNIFVRCKYNNIWSSWKPLLTDEAGVWIQGFDRTKKQMLVHPSNNNTMLWEDVQ